MNNITRHIEIRDQINLAYMKLVNIFGNINNAITIYDRGFNILNTNKASSEILDITQDKVLSQKCHQSYHGADSPSEECPCCRYDNFQVVYYLQNHLSKKVFI